MGSHFHLPDFLDGDRGNQRRASDVMALGLELTNSDSNLPNSCNSMSPVVTIPVNNNSQSASSHGTLSTSVEDRTNKGKLFTALRKNLRTIGLIFLSLFSPPT